MIQVFESERLVCRHWEPGDIDTIFAVYSDKESVRWVGNGTPITDNECQDWLLITKQNYLNRGYGMFALDDKATNQTIGFCGLVHPSEQIEPEIKYAFLRSHWSKGYASEAVPKLLEYGALQHQLKRIIATVAHEHLASQRVLVKSGMKYTHTITEPDGSLTQVFEWIAKLL